MGTTCSEKELRAKQVQDQEVPLALNTEENWLMFKGTASRGKRDPTAGSGVIETVIAHSSFNMEGK